MQKLHHLLLAVDAIDVAEPGIAGAELRPRLLEYQRALGRLDAHDDIGHAAAEGFDLGRADGDPALSAEVVQCVGGGQFEHGHLAGYCRTRASGQETSIAGHESTIGTAVRVDGTSLFRAPAELADGTRI